ncbi:MAG TPA: response regulator [Thermoanaerobaculia bacterium]|nr:response regulator [Thermoanaerobaculia bacterium]
MASESILIVDDNVWIRRLLLTLLGRQGYECEQAHDGVKAIEMLRSGSWSGVVLDLMMPRADGLEVIRFLEAERSDLLERTIVVTADSGRWGHGNLDRVARVVRKPFDVEEFVKVASDVFGAAPGPSG